MDGYVCRFAKEAEKKALMTADLFEGVAAIEKEHEERYKLCKCEGGLVFSRDEDMICSVGCNIVIGKKAPRLVPCAHPQAYFQIKAENY